MEDGKKVAIALSGGVDSGVAAALLVEEGYEVVGIHLDLGIKGLKGLNEEAARRTAERLGIPFYVEDYSQDFKKIVVDYFLAEYAAGRTPNPCVVCNQFIKFGKLLDYACALGGDYLATGHYARVKGIKGGKGYKLLKGIDESKDQSYFLWTLTQDKLARVLFPIGNLKKPEVRKLARTKNLPISERPESFEACFVQDKDYRDFLKRRIPEAMKPGEVVNTRGDMIGEHFGLPLYTIGQRKGFEVRSSVPLYVVGSNLEENQLIVGRGAESERQRFAVSGINWVSGRVPEGEVVCQVRVRYQSEPLNSKLKFQNSKLTSVALEEPVRGVTPGQSAVFYRGEEVLGGGVIER